MQADDVLQWELDQVEKLEKLADIYDWASDSKEYRQRLKLIQLQSVARQKALGRRGQVAACAVGVPPMRSAGAEAVAMATTMKRHKPVGWVDQPPAKGKRFKGFVNAKALLGEGPHGPWLSDRDAPSGNGWRRYISKDNTSGEFTRARIVANRGICLICKPTVCALRCLSTLSPCPLLQSVLASTCCNSRLKKNR